MVEGVRLDGARRGDFEEILTPEALSFVATLHRASNARRLELLERRVARQAQLDAGEAPGFLEQTAEVRSGDWSVAPIPESLQRRWVEITGPVERKMVLNALNSGADVFMADFEDANSPTWTNTIQGQLNLRDAVRRTITFEHPTKGTYTLKDAPATLLVRPRGWHLEEKHLLVDGQRASASLVDFGLYFFHNAAALLELGAGPFFYLPKLESHLEARLWNDVFLLAQETLGMPKGTIKATVLLENILLSFEIDEVLFELREHIAGINAGRWDYIFSAIKKFRNQDVVFPDRAQVTMGVPFMRAYTDLLVKTCHARGAHAIGGMAAFIPSRDPEVNAAALDKVRADKVRESRSGFDGTWVAHPGLVPVARDAFAQVLGERAHQKDVLLEDVEVTAAQLVNFSIDGGAVTEAGARLNINVGIRYIASWLGGVGAAAIHNLMEDAATAEISRSQIWQWLHSGTLLADGRTFERALYDQLVEEELHKIAEDVGAEAFETDHFLAAREVFDLVATGDTFAEFLTLEAYERLD
ncbi:MAG: malate synthase A [Myxococcota bacterium]